MQANKTFADIIEELITGNDNLLFDRNQSNKSIDDIA